MKIVQFSCHDWFTFIRRGKTLRVSSRIIFFDSIRAIGQADRSVNRKPLPLKQVLSVLSTSLSHNPQPVAASSRVLFHDSDSARKFLLASATIYRYTGYRSDIESMSRTGEICRLLHHQLPGWPPDFRVGFTISLHGKGRVQWTSPYPLP